MPGSLHVSVSVRNRQQYPAGLNLPQHGDTTQHRATHPPPSSFVVDLGFGLSSTHTHTHTHIQTHIKWLISEKARITSRQTWQTRQSQPPTTHPFCQPRQVNGPVASHEQPPHPPEPRNSGLIINTIVTSRATSEQQQWQQIQL